MHRGGVGPHKAVEDPTLPCGHREVPEAEGSPCELDIWQLMDADGSFSGKWQLHDARFPWIWVGIGAPGFCAGSKAA